MSFLIQDRWRTEFQRFPLLIRFMPLLDQYCRATDLLWTTLTLRFVSLSGTYLLRILLRFKFMQLRRILRRRLIPLGMLLLLLAPLFVTMIEGTRRR
jgi:hypothetical protein